MSKTFFYLLFLTTLPVIFQPAVAADPPEARSQFPYALLSADSIDMRTLQPGSQAQGSLTITNAGRYDLVISRVRSSCGLLITTWPAQPLKPGEQGTISFRYDTTRPGPFDRNIVIHTNAWQKNIVVPVKGQVMPANTKPSD